MLVLLAQGQRGCLLSASLPQAAFDAMALHHGLDVWSASPGRHVVARVPPSTLLQGLPASRYQVLHPNLETALVAERSSAGKGFHSKYRSYQEIQDRLKHLAAKHSSFASVETVGKSGGDKDILAFSVHAAGPKKDEAPILFLQAGQHAREWIAPAGGLVMMDHFLTEAAKGGGLPGYQESFVALANPDGYEYSRTANRMWRKNRDRSGEDHKELEIRMAATSNSFDRDQCIGVDTNRNWPSHFGKTMVQGKQVTKPGKQCSQTFEGSQGDSEPEVSALTGHVAGLGKRVIAFLDLHSFGEKLLPPGCNGFPVPEKDTAEHLRAGQVLIEAMNAAAGGSYVTGPCGKEMYVCSGTAGDWAYQMAQIKHSWSLELRPADKDAWKTNRGGFVVEPAQIRPVGKELFMGIQALAADLTKGPGAKMI